MARTTTTSYTLTTDEAVALDLDRLAGELRRMAESVARRTGRPVSRATERRLDALRLEVLTLAHEVGPAVVRAPGGAA